MTYSFRHPYQEDDPTFHDEVRSSDYPQYSEVHRTMVKFIRMFVNSETLIGWVAAAGFIVTVV